MCPCIRANCDGAIIDKQSRPAETLSSANISKHDAVDIKRREATEAASLKTKICRRQADLSEAIVETEPKKLQIRSIMRKTANHFAIIVVANAAAGIREGEFLCGKVRVDVLCLN